MPLEDFTTYTEVDPDGDITVVSNEVSCDDLQARSVDAYVYKDKGVGHFSGDFEHRFKIKKGNRVNTPLLCFWGMANIIDDFEDWISSGGDAYALHTRIAANLHLDMIENGVLFDDGSTLFEDGVWHYIRVARDDDGGVNGTGQLKAYIATNDYDDNGGTLEDTLVLDCGVGEQNDFRYVYAMATYNDGVPNYTIDGRIANLNLEEVVNIPIAIHHYKQLAGVI